MEPTTTLLIEGFIREFIILVLLGGMGVLWRAYQNSQESRIKDVKTITELAERQAANNEKLVNAVASLTEEIRRWVN